MVLSRDAAWALLTEAGLSFLGLNGVGAEPSPPRVGPSSEANVMWPVPPRLTVH